MKKSNKTTIFYILSSVLLFFLLIGGGCYGVYLSIGLSFVRNGVSNLVDGVARNVSFGGTVNFSSSMISVIILSIALIILSIFDFILLIKQIIFFKQFKIIKESDFEKTIEKKSKSKSSVIILAFIIDIISFITGIIGILINSKTFPSNNVSWPLSVIDGLVSLFAVVSIVLLIIKLKSRKTQFKDNSNEISKNNTEKLIKEKNINFSFANNNSFDIDQIEYNLLKLKQLKTAKIINSEEYEKMRKSIIGINTLSSDDDKIISDQQP